jgi:hypothetical protein
MLENVPPPGEIACRAGIVPTGRVAYEPNSLDPSAALFEKAAVPADDGVVALEGREGIAGFIAAAKRQRIWERETPLRSPG